MRTTFSAFWKSGKIKAKFSSLDFWKVKIEVADDFLFFHGGFCLFVELLEIIIFAQDAEMQFIVLNILNKKKI